MGGSLDSTMGAHGLSIKAILWRDPFQAIQKLTLDFVVVDLAKSLEFIPLLFVVIHNWNT